MRYLHAMRHYTDFQGRARRIDFWEFTGGWAMLTMVAYALDRMRAGPHRQSDDILVLIVTMAHLVPYCAVAARRSHDLGRTGWLSLLGLVPFVSVAMLLVWTTIAGTSGPNRFGPEPGSGADGDASGQAKAVEARAGRSRTEPDAMTTPRPSTERVLASTAPLAIVAELERLADLLFAGTLTDAEFEALKQQVLDKGRSR